MIPFSPYAQLQQQYGFTPSKGAVILDVLSGSPADKAGLAQGDVIVALDRPPITGTTSLSAFLGKTKPGQSVQVTYYLGDEKRTTNVTLESQSAEQQQSQSSQGGTGSVIPGFGGNSGSGNSGSGNSGSGNSGFGGIG